MQRSIVFNDYLTRFVLPVCSALRDRKDAGTAVTSAVYLVDVGTWNMKQVWNIRAYVQDFTTLLATCYPEVVHRVYVSALDFLDRPSYSLTHLTQALNAPSYMGAFWAILSKCVDARTASKVQFVYPAQVESTLDSVIDRDYVPVQYGGQYDLQYGQPPRLDGGILQSIKSSSLGPGGNLPPGPIKLGVNGEGEMTLIAVGSDKEKRRREIIGVIS
jgi:hypothetical protein